jgi:hypothetical protein
VARGEWLEKNSGAEERFLLRLENVFSFVSMELDRLSNRGGVAIRNLFPATGASTDRVGPIIL